jgi:hypothetical protein
MKLLSQIQNEEIPSEDEKIWRISHRKWVALWCKGNQSIPSLCVRLMGSIGSLTTTEGEHSALKTHKKDQKTKFLNRLSKSG